MLKELPPLEKVIAVTEALEIALYTLGSPRPVSAKRRRQQFDTCERRLQQSGMDLAWSRGGAPTVQYHDAYQDAAPSEPNPSPHPRPSASICGFHSENHAQTLPI